MASSSSLSDKGTDGRSVLEPPGERRKAEQSTRSYNVFINHRGPDVKETLALQLYNSLDKVGIQAFLYQEEKEPGVLFPSTIKTAIQSAKVQIAIFSIRYAESPWCMEELLLMLKTEVKIIPLFYEVEPWELRHLEKGSYNQAFKNYEEKSRYTEKLEEWKEALNRMSYVAGYIIRELPAADVCKEVVVAVQNEMETIDYLNVKKYSKLVEELESWCFDHLLSYLERDISDCLEDLDIRVSDRLEDLAGEYGINEDENWSLKRATATQAVESTAWMPCLPPYVHVHRSRRTLFSLSVSGRVRAMSSACPEAQIPMHEFHAARQSGMSPGLLGRSQPLDGSVPLDGVRELL